MVKSCLPWTHIWSNCKSRSSFQISESLEGVTISEDSDLNIYKEDKRTQHTWTFTVKTKVKFS